MYLPSRQAALARALGRPYAFDRGSFFGECSCAGGRQLGQDAGPQLSARPLARNQHGPMPDLDPTRGTLAHLLLYLRQLPTAGDDGFLVISVPEADDAFLQVTWSPDGFGVDHPVVTPAQQSREQAVRDACAAVGHEVQEVPLNDGSHALDCYLPDDPQATAVVVAAILTAACGVSDTSILEYSGSGISAIAG